MLIALDYDDTFTRDKQLWWDFVLSATKRGHSVIVVTARHERYRAEVEADLGDMVEAILCTGGKAKRAFAYAAGYMVSVWVDDQPQWIDTDAYPSEPEGITW